jgi:hypothetical protein
MAGGIYNTKIKLNTCNCGNNPLIIWHYIKGVANKIHYFVKCNNCKKRTRDRKYPNGAIDDWNTFKFI